MTAHRLVSIIINNYNYGHFVAQAIDSALNQTYPSKEVIVVDDDSTDHSRTVIANFGPRIIQVLKSNEGQASTFNAGFAHSQGEVVVFLDADDYLLPGALECAVPHFADPRVAKVHWPLWEVTEKGENTGQLHTKSLIEGDFRDQFIEHGPISLPQSPTSGNAWARWFLDQVLPLPEHEDKHGADGFLKKLCPIFGEIRRLHEPQGCYRLHRANYGGGRDEMFKLRRGLRRYSLYCHLLEEHLRRMGVEVSSLKWMGAGSQYAWLRDAVAVQDELTPRIPKGSTLVLIDDNAFGGALLPECHAIPLIEFAGQYGGAPSDDEQAIVALEQRRHGGADFLAFTFPALWWVDYYQGLVRHLEQNSRCIFRNERIVLYDLRHSPGNATGLDKESRCETPALRIGSAAPALRNGVTVAEMCQRVLGDRPTEVIPLGEASNDCGAFRMRVRDRWVKCYECSSPDRASRVQLATRALAAHEIAIPRVYEIAEHVVFAEWIEGQTLSMPLQQTTFEQWVAYQAEIHRATVDVSNPAASSFLHLEWLLRRLKLAGAKFLGSEMLEHLCACVRASCPPRLKYGIVHPDFIPSNVVLTPARKMMVVDNEFLAVDVGYEFDILNTSYVLGGGDELRRQGYLEAYSQVGDFGTLHSHENFWEMCYLVKVIGKCFLVDDLTGAHRHICRLEERIDRDRSGVDGQVSRTREK